MQRANYCSVFMLGVLYVTNSLNQVSGQTFGNPCISEMSCGQCIRKHPDCAWCSEEDFLGSRCDYTGYLAEKCSAPNVVFPEKIVEIMADSELSNEGQIVQLKPQRVNLKLKPNTSYTLAIDFRKVLNQGEQRLSPRVQLQDNATGNVWVTYYSTCTDGNREKRNSCSGPNIDTQVINFEAHIEVTSCPKNPRDWKQTFQIYPLGILEEIIVNLEMICDCNCEKPWAVEKNSDKCMLNGNYECGICSCNNYRFGRRCECDARGMYLNDDDGCTMENTVCSGRGSCVCGSCECYPQENEDRKVTGRYCECDNFSCDRADGAICGGPERGVCMCGSCLCNQNWTGSACECKSTVDTCMGDNGEICSGHGHCVCGRCKCFDTGDVRYSGALCQHCPTCPSLCDFYKDYVQCQMYQTGRLTESECQNCTFVVIQTTKVEIESEGERICVFHDESDDCRFIFKYEENNHGAIYAQTSKVCPQP